MRILLAGQAYYRIDNGQAAFTVRLAEGLAGAGQSVCVVAPSTTGKAKTTEIDGVTVAGLPNLHFGFNVNVTAFTDRRVTDILTEFAPDIVHIQDHYFISRSVRRVAQRLGIPVVGTNHFLPENLTDNFLVPQGLKQLIHRLMWANMLHVFNQLTAATTPTQTAVDILTAQPITIPVIPISCGVDQQRFTKIEDYNWPEFRRKYRLDPDKTLFVYVGRVDREKDLDILVKAAARLDREDIQIAIGGKGSYLKGLKSLAAQLGVLDSRVRFLGFVPDEELPLLLNSADYFAMPSHAELQSIATLEGMSCGLPVLAADARALPELVGHGENGYLFQVGSVADAARGLSRLADQYQQWGEMSALSLQKAEKHSLENTVAAYSRWYAEAAGLEAAATRPA